MRPLRAVASLAISSCLLGAAGVHSAGQSPARSTDAPGVTDLIDFLATAEDGRPITDLKASEVTFRVDGRVRDMRSFEFVELASTVLNERVGRLSMPLPEPFGSNRLADNGRIIILVIDHESIRAGKERPAKDAAARFLAGLSPRDRVGLMTMPHGWSIEPTMNHEEIREGLARITGQSPEQRVTSDSLCHARLTLNTLMGVLQSLAGLDGPKTIAFISSGLRTPNRDGPMTRAPGACELRSVAYDEVAAAAGAARAHFYVIQPHDETVDSAANAFADMEASRFGSADEDLAGLQNLAGVTGGEIFRLTSQRPEAVFTRVAYESSGYYVIAFEPLPSERNGLPHRVDVRVARDGVMVRTVPQFTIGKAEGLGADITPQKMLRVGRSFRDLALRATAYASRMPGESTLKIVAAAEPMDPSVKLKAAAVGLFDAKGRLTAQSTADARELGTLPLVAALPASPGLYTLRVAAIDAAGRRGTVDYRFRADLTTATAAGLKCSALALGISPNGSFVPRLQFGREPAAVVLFEIYGNPPGSTEITVRLELAEGEDAPAILSAPATPRTTGAADTRIVVGVLPIAAAAPGDYVVRAIVSVDGRPAARVYRTLRKGQF